MKSVFVKMATNVFTAYEACVSSPGAGVGWKMIRVPPPTPTSQSAIIYFCSFLGKDVLNTAKVFFIKKTFKLLIK